MRRTVEIEKKEWDARKSARELRTALDAGGHSREWLTPTDASAISGLPLHLCEPALLLLAGEAGAELRVEEDGTICFRFDDLSRDPFGFQLSPRLRTFVDRTGRFVERTGKMVTGLVGSQIGGVTLFVLGMLTMNILPEAIAVPVATAVLIVAAVLSLPLLMSGAIIAIVTSPHILAMPVAEKAFFALLTLPLFAIFGLGFAIMAGWYERLFDQWAPWLTALSNFGETKQEALDDEALFGQLASAKGGRITLGDVMVLYGWTRDEAFRQMTRLAVDYDGDVEVTEDGRIVFVFPAFARRSGSMPRPAWEREVSPNESLGSTGRRAGPLAMLGWTVSTAALLFLIQNMFGAPLGANLVSAVPGGTDTLLAVAALFGAVPLFVVFRSFAILLRAWRYRSRSRLLKALRQITSSDGRIRVDTDEVDNEVVLALDGVVDEEADGEGVVLEFPELVQAYPSR